MLVKFYNHQTGVTETHGGPGVNCFDITVYDKAGNPIKVNVTDKSVVIDCRDGRHIEYPFGHIVAPHPVTAQGDMETLYAKRVKEADMFFGEIDLGVEVEDAGGWEIDGKGDELVRSVFIENGKKPSIKKTLVVTFDPDTSNIAFAIFDGEDVAGSIDWSENRQAVQAQDEKRGLYPEHENPAN